MNRAMSDLSCRCFIVIIFSIYLFLSVELFYPPLQILGLKQMHLRIKSFGVWSLLHLTPWMYNYANTLLIIHNPSSAQIHDETILDNAQDATWINHYPLRVVTFDDGREIVSLSNEKWMVVAKSTYQQQSLLTKWFLQKNASGVIEITQE